MISDYHALYFTKELTRVGGNGIERLGRALFDACVDLNPHQIEAALFALRSPVSKGVLLADEVGLGKTIEAGLVLCQYWAERKRSILVICPASLRKQWEVELSEKFNIPSFVLDAKIFREMQKKGIPNPFRTGSVVICSMHFAASRMMEIKAIEWDMVIIDEAHKLRNAYRSSNRIGQNIFQATENRKKILLTATPLQNSLLELYGLTYLIDERIFGEVSSFRTQYVNQGGDMGDLRKRLSLFCWRSLRSQVTEFVQYTERKLHTRPFKPTEQEHKLYEAVSAYLMRDNTYALPVGQRHLLVMLVRKVLASSPKALAGTLEIMRGRLLRIKDETNKQSRNDEFSFSEDDLDEDIWQEIQEDIEDRETDSENSEADNESCVDAMRHQDIDMQLLQSEINELSDYIRWANSLGIDTKTKALLAALKIGFAQMEEMGAEPKVVVFTESTRTQTWLKDFLEGNGYCGEVLTFNGTNKDDHSGEIYREWVANNSETGRVSGSRAVDLRAAIIDCFKNKAKILIATEAGAEGLNLQFCSAIINFDLPWNPQRIEQRIGRCHRYGQKHDVVVINFLNERNEADKRVYELLENKFQLFSGIFGASDEILGAVEAGVDFERRILEIYQTCRSEGEIQERFRDMQKQLEEQIQAKMRDTQKMLLEHFDEDVHSRLRMNWAGTQDYLDKMGRMFWLLTQHILGQQAVFDHEKHEFVLNQSPSSSIGMGRYFLISKTGDAAPSDFLYRLNHPLGEYVLAEGMKCPCPPAEVVFDITNHPTRILAVEKLCGESGWLKLLHLNIQSFESKEYLLFSAIDEQGNNIDHETCEKLFQCYGKSGTIGHIPSDIELRLEQDAMRHVQATTVINMDENNKHFSEERDQLHKWAQDMEMAAQKELDDVKRQIQELQRQSHLAPTLAEQKELQNAIAKLEKKKRSLRQNLFDVEDEIAEKRDMLVEQLQKRMQQKSTITPLFTIKWKVI